MKLLFEHFELLAEAPNGIPKLRELILQLAVQGKLVPQDPNDEPAGELLQRIQAEKERLIAEGKLRKEKALPLVRLDEIPYKLPDGWRWVRFYNILKELYRYPNFYGLKQVNNGIPVIRIGHLNLDQSISHNWDTYWFISEEDSKKFPRTILQVGDIIMGVRGSIGKLGIVDSELDGAQISPNCLRISPMHLFMDTNYISNFLLSNVAQQNISTLSTATAISTIKANLLKKMLFPLPPLPEQKRIVAKVEQLMALCDELEQKQAQRSQKRSRLNNAALNKLLTAPGPEEFREHWQRIANNFELLYDAPETLTQLKQAILQLAVQGKLVKQNPADEPAGELLKRIRVEKERLIAEGKIKKEKPLPPVSEREIPYPLPEGWVWCRLGDIIKISSGDSLTSTEMNLNGNIPVYGGNGITGYHDQYNVNESTIVIGRVGFYCGSIHLTEGYAWITDNAFKTVYSKENLDRDFLVWLLKGTNLKENESATAQPVISGRKIYPIVIGIPPLVEQNRIVAKVKELLNLCNALEEQLTRARQKSERLMAAVAQGVVGGK